MKYFVTINDQEVIVEIDGEQVLVDGVASTASVAHIDGTPEVHLTVDGSISRYAVDSVDLGVVRLVDHGAVREIGVENERARHIRQMAGAGKASGGQSVVKAPMPGLVLRVLVKEGDAVTPGMGLLALEAMKMENEIKATGAGVVKSVTVKAGDVVEKGKVLIELGPA